MADCENSLYSAFVLSLCKILVVQPFLFIVMFTIDIRFVPSKEGKSWWNLIFLLFQVVSKPGICKTYKRFEAEIYVLTKDKGGCHTASFPNYRPQFYSRTVDVTGKVELPENIKMAMPGDNVTASWYHQFLLNQVFFQHIENDPLVKFIVHLTFVWTKGPIAAYWPYSSRKWLVSYLIDCYFMHGSTLIWNHCNGENQTLNANLSLNEVWRSSMKLQDEKGLTACSKGIMIC